MMKKIIVVFVMGIILFSLGGCSKEETLKDGYYTARMDGYDHEGWQEFVTMVVSNGEIVTVEYNAKASSGFIKSWDIAYMRMMNPIQGTYPNNYTRRYAASFLESQSSEDIDIVSGASTSGANFKLLTAALLEKAKAGDSSVAIVAYPS